MEELILKLIEQLTQQIAKKLIEHFETCQKEEEKVLDVKEVAGFLKVPESWVYEKVRHGEIPYHKVGHYTRFLKSEILEWLKTGTVKQKKVKKVV